MDKMTRREFLKTSAFLGGCVLLTTSIDKSLFSTQSFAEDLGNANAYPLAKAENIIYSTCLQCHTDCPIKVKILNGVVVKIDGNPYSPVNLIPHIPYKSSPSNISRLDGKVCPKGQAGIQTLYDPYRIRKVLKRSGPRGSNKWQVIPFDQAISEIVEGGLLFKGITGEGTRSVPGLRSLFQLKDPDTSKKMAADAKLVATGQMKVDAFKTKYKKNSSSLIDAQHPDLGPLNNQFVFLAGRIEHGRKDFAKRWLNNSFGSVNWFEHTTNCEQSHHIAFKEATKTYKDGAWTGGKENLMPDAPNSEFIIFFGTGAFEANFGPPSIAEKITEGLVTGRLKIAVIDPRMSKTAARAYKWVPIKPGTDAAFAFGMIRWIIENERYDANYLKNANRAAVNANNESTWTNAAYLVRIDKDGPSSLLRAKDIGLGDADTFVVVKNGKPVAVNWADDKTAVQGDIFYEGTISGITVKTALALLKERAFENTINEWSQIAGVAANDIITLAKEFTSHGRKACAEFYRGVVQHTNGYYNGQAVIMLNLLVGNPDWQGGLSTGGGHWHEMGDKRKGPFDLKNMHPAKISAFGPKLTREGVNYEESTLFTGYPAKRPWFPRTSNVYQEVLPSAKDGYPYKIKAVFMHKATPGLSVPGANAQIDVLADLDAIPLLFADDIVIGDSSMYADYIFPDASVWERWGTPHASPDIPTKISKFRQPTVTPITETVKVFGEDMHISMEAVMLAIAENLGMPGYGKNGFGEGWDFTRPEQFYLKEAANIAAGDKTGDEVPDADFNEVKLFTTARRYLDKATFDFDMWGKAVGEKWLKKTVYVLNRGGRCEDFTDLPPAGGLLLYKFNSMFNIYAEHVALTKHSMTGKRFSGTPVYAPVTDIHGGEVKDSQPLALITYKDILGGQSRTLPTDYWLSDVLPENHILINSQTGGSLGFQDGDLVKIVSETNPAGEWDLKTGQKLPVAGKIEFSEGIAKGVIAVSWHFGHWAYGASDVYVDGQVVKGDKRRSKGLCPNAVMRLDPYLKNVCLQDPIGGSSSFYDTKVSLVKA